jgi:hypothetical protein
MDFLTVPTLTGHVLFVLVLLAHQRRRIIHLNVTEHPTAAWTAQQMIEAFPDDTVRLDGCYGIETPSMGTRSGAALPAWASPKSSPLRQARGRIRMPSD